jgi:hypothetical protein
MMFQLTNAFPAHALQPRMSDNVGIDDLWSNNLLFPGEDVFHTTSRSTSPLLFHDEYDLDLDADLETSAYGLTTNTLGVAQAGAIEAVAQKKTKRARNDTEASCQVCARKFNSAGARERHMLSHTKVKPFKCTVCDKTFSQKVNMKAHVNAVHKKIKHACHICSQKLSSPTNLAHHITKTHAAPGKHGALMHCDVCNIFMRGDMNRHCGTDKHMRVAAAQAATLPAAASSAPGAAST